VVSLSQPSTPPTCIYGGNALTYVLGLHCIQYGNGHALRQTLTPGTGPIELNGRTVTAYDKTSLPEPASDMSKHWLVHTSSDSVSRCQNEIGRIASESKAASSGID
jgi:hypothetical protein